MSKPVRVARSRPSSSRSAQGDAEQEHNGRGAAVEDENPPLERVKVANSEVDAASVFHASPNPRGEWIGRIRFNYGGSAKRHALVAPPSP
jgi:hypothetical protein